MTYPSYVHGTKCLARPGAKPSKLFTPSPESSASASRPSNGKLGHVERLVEKDRRLLPSLLLVTPVRELGRHAGVDVRARRRIAQQLDGVRRVAEDVLQATTCHVVPSQDTTARVVDAARKQSLLHGLGDVEEMSPHGALGLGGAAGDDCLHDGRVLRDGRG